MDKTKIAIIGVGSVLILGILGIPKTVTTIKEQAKEEYRLEVEKVHSEAISSLANEKSQLQSQLQSLKQEFQQKETLLQSQIRELRSSTSSSYVKIVHPDGTIEERKLDKSETLDLSKTVLEMERNFEIRIEEEKQIVSQQYEKQLVAKTELWSKEKSELNHTIETLKVKTETVVNPRQWRLEAGMLTDKTIYSHTTYDLFNPFFLGTQVEKNGDKYKSGIGIGVKF